MRTIPQIIEDIRARRVPIKLEGDPPQIIARGMLLRREKYYIKAHRDEAIEYLRSHPQPEISPEPIPEVKPFATMRDTIEYQEGFRDGEKHAREELQRRFPTMDTAPPPVPAPPPEAAKALRKRWERPRSIYYPWEVVWPSEFKVEGELSHFDRHQRQKSPYYWWEPECLAALRAALVPGDMLSPLYAYSVLIVHADGTEVEFKRVPLRVQRTH